MKGSVRFLVLCAALGAAAPSPAAESAAPGLLALAGLAPRPDGSALASVATNVLLGETLRARVQLRATASSEEPAAEQRLRLHADCVFDERPAPRHPWIAIAGSSGNLVREGRWRARAGGGFELRGDFRPRWKPGDGSSRWAHMMEQYWGKPIRPGDPERMVKLVLSLDAPGREELADPAREVPPAEAVLRFHVSEKDGIGFPDPGPLLAELRLPIGFALSPAPPGALARVSAAFDPAWDPDAERDEIRRARQIERAAAGGSATAYVPWASMRDAPPEDALQTAIADLRALRDMPFDWSAFRPAPDGHADWSCKPNWRDQTSRFYFAKELLLPFRCKNAGSCAPSFLAAELMRVGHEGAARTKDVRIGWNPVPGADDKPRRDASGKILFADWHYTFAEEFWNGSQWISHALFHIARDIVADDPPELARPFFEELADLAAHPPFDPDGFAARESAVHSTPWDDRTRGWWNDRADFIENLVRDHGFFHGWGR